MISGVQESKGLSVLGILPFVGMVLSGLLIVRGNGTVEYCAYLFPVVDSVRVLGVSEEGGNAEYAFRYLSIPDDKEWVDHGWSYDEYDEFEGWYAGTGAIEKQNTTS